MTSAATKLVLLVPNHSLFVVGDEIVIETAEVHLVQALQEKGLRVRLASFVEPTGHTSLSGVVPRETTEIVKLNWHGHRDRGLLRSFNYLAASVRACAALRGVQQAYLFCPGHCTVIVALWAIALRVPFGLYVRCTWLRNDGSTPALWRYIFKRAAFIIATGEAFRRKLRQYNDRVENEVPLTTMRIAAVEAEIDRRSRCVRNLLFVGRLTPEKGVLDIVRALAILRSHDVVDLRLTIIGGGSAQELKELDDEISRHCVGDFVIRLGHVSNPDVLMSCYREADVFVFPSYFREGFPRVLYEAMMFAVPIVTTWMPGTDGFLQDCRNSLLCKQRDPDDLARCIARLVREPQFAAKIGAMAQQDVRTVFESFTHASHAQQLMDFIGVGENPGAHACRP